MHARWNAEGLHFSAFHFFIITIVSIIPWPMLGGGGLANCVALVLRYNL